MSGFGRGWRARVVAAFALTAAASPPSAWAWGPHPKITTAAIATLAPDDPLARRLGREVASLGSYCWLADWRGTLVRRPEGTSFLADDYLLFPGSPRHVEHECPAVESTFRPFFRRAVQALRTETPENAARWVGSLLHFVEDTGSPPHAFPTSGVLHTRMENWVDAEAIELGGYRPRSLGETDDAALEGFVARMQGLIAYSRERGEKVRPLAEAERRAEAEPIILESALETSRVVADLLLTLGRLAGRKPAESATLRGRIASRPVAGGEAFPAKIFLQKTDVSTLAAADGTFALEDIPPGTYMAVVVRAGSRPAFRGVTLRAGETGSLDVTMDSSEPPGCLLRDPLLQLHWLGGPGPDGWRREGRGEAGAWKSDPLPVEGGRSYRLAVRWKPGVRGSAALRWDGSAQSAGPERETGGTTETWTFRSPREARQATIVLICNEPPDVACEGVSFAEDRADEARGAAPGLHPGRLVLTCLEIPDYGHGAGLAAVLQAPGGKTYLYDTGSGYPNRDGKGWSADYNAGRDTVLPFLAASGRGAVDGVMMSHGHYDHFGGLLWLVDHVPIPLLIDPGYELAGTTNGELRAYSALRERFKKTPGGYLAAHAGDRLELDPALSVEVVSPPAAFYQANPKCLSRNDTPDHYAPNANSLGVRITHGSVSFLLPGDVQTTDQEELILSNVPPDKLRCDVLVAPAHGIDASEAFAKATNAGVVIASAGGRYARWSQTPRVYGRLGARVLVTGVHGRVGVLSDGRSYSVDVERPDGTNPAVR